LLPCDWLIRCLCQRVVEQAYLIKLLVSVYIYVYTITVFFLRVSCISLVPLQLFSLIRNCFSIKYHFLFALLSLSLFQQGLKMLLCIIYLIFFCCLSLAPRLMSSGKSSSVLALCVPLIICFVILFSVEVNLVHCHF